MLTIVAMAGALTPFAVGLTEAFKRLLDESIQARFYPTIALVMGILLGEFVSWILNIDFRVGILIGMGAGLSACGLFAYGKTKEEDR